MRILSRLADRYRTAGGNKYGCTLCGATFDDPAVLICPKCRGLVTRRVS